MIRARAAAVWCILLTSIVWAVLASDPPDSEINPQTGYIETVDSVWRSSRYDIRHVLDPGGGLPKAISYLTDGDPDDNGARIEISQSGNTWVSWWRDGSTDEIFLRKHTYSTGTWSGEVLVSQTGESARDSEIVFDGTDAWVVYEYDSGSSTAIGMAGINDDPDPFPTSHIELSTTSYTGDVDPLVNSESGNLWATWVDSSTQVGWREYDYTAETWSSVQYESYSSDTVADARARIRTTVLGN